jgi:hypothetical protein
MDLTQSEIEYLLSVLKQIDMKNGDRFDFPTSGTSKKLDLISCSNNKDKFIIDINRKKKRVQSLQITFNERYRNDIILVRLDLHGPPHRNPDNQLISGNHLHIAREGYNDRFAIEVPEKFVNLSDPVRTLIDFLDYCNVVNHSKLKIMGAL